MRTRTCEGSKNGGQCYGNDTEIRKCGKNALRTENVTRLEQRGILRYNSPSTVLTQNDEKRNRNLRDGIYLYHSALLPLS